MKDVNEAYEFTYEEDAEYFYEFIQHQHNTDLGFGLKDLDCPNDKEKLLTLIRDSLLDTFGKEPVKMFIGKDGHQLSLNVNSDKLMKLKSNTSMNTPINIVGKDFIRAVCDRDESVIGFFTVEEDMGENTHLRITFRGRKLYNKILP